MWNHVYVLSYYYVHSQDPGGENNIDISQQVTAHPERETTVSVQLWCSISLFPDSCSGSISDPKRDLLIAVLDPSISNSNWEMVLVNGYSTLPHRNSPVLLILIKS